MCVEGRGEGVDVREGRGDGVDVRQGRGKGVDVREERGEGVDVREGRGEGVDLREGRGGGRVNAREQRREVGVGARIVQGREKDARVILVGEQCSSELSYTAGM